MDNPGSPRSPLDLYNPNMDSRRDNLQRRIDEEYHENLRSIRLKFIIYNQLAYVRLLNLRIKRQQRQRDEDLRDFSQITDYDELNIRSDLIDSRYADLTITREQLRVANITDLFRILQKEIKWFYHHLIIPKIRKD